MFDILFFNIFNYYKASLKRKANRVAVIYVSLVQFSLLILFGILFRLFCNQMKVSALSSEASWTLASLGALFIYFNNWMTYTGKKRMQIKPSVKNSTDYNIWLLWLLPIFISAFIATLWNKL